MRKSTAFVLLGPAVKDVADAVGCSGSAVRQWPELLPRRIADRVLAAWARKNMPDALKQQLEQAEQATASNAEQVANAA